MHAAILAIHLGSSAVSMSENHEGPFCTGVHDGAGAGAGEGEMLLFPGWLGMNVTRATATSALASRGSFKQCAIFSSSRRFL